MGTPPPVAMRGTVEHPAGLAYQEDLLTAAEEEALLARFEATELEPVVVRGHAARRTVRHYGYTYDFDSWGLSPAEPPPAYLDDLRQRCADLAGVEAEAWEEVLVTRYAPGDGIGWHRDAAAFGPVVIGVSLGSDAVMRFQRRAAGGERRVFEQPLARRSAYVLAGAARSAWQHSVPPVRAERWSVTVRTVRARATPRPAPGSG
jgi:DNA oxidative demethylase